MGLTKADIVERVHKEGGFSKKDAAEFIDLVFKIMKDTLAKGERIKIPGFGNFLVRDKASRMGRNPQTGEAMSIAARRVLTFRPSQVLKEDVTSRYAHRMSPDGREDASIPPERGTSKALNYFIDLEDWDGDE